MGAGLVGRGVLDVADRRVGDLARRVVGDLGHGRLALLHGEGEGVAVGQLAAVDGLGALEGNVTGGLVAVGERANAGLAIGDGNGLPIDSDRAFRTARTVSAVRCADDDLASTVILQVELHYMAGAVIGNVIFDPIAVGVLRGTLWMVLSNRVRERTANARGGVHIRQAEGHGAKIGRALLIGGLVHAVH